MIKEWTITPEENELWKAEIKADTETINKIENFIQDLQERGENDK